MEATINYIFSIEILALMYCFLRRHGSMKGAGLQSWRLWGWLIANKCGRKNVTEIEADTARRPTFSHNKQMASQSGKKGGKERDERNIKGWDTNAWHKRTRQRAEWRGPNELAAYAESWASPNWGRAGARPCVFSPLRAPWDRSRLDQRWDLLEIKGIGKNWPESDHWRADCDQSLRGDCDQSKFRV